MQDARVTIETSWSEERAAQLAADALLYGQRAKVRIGWAQREPVANAWAREHAAQAGQWATWAASKARRMLDTLEGAQ